MAKAPAKEAKPTNEFSDYRHALVVEFKTIWPNDLKAADADRARIASALHADPKAASILTYIRCPTGFVQAITVTQADLDRLKK